MKGFLFCALMFTMPALASPPSSEPNPIDIRHYAFYLELNDTTDIVFGKAEITLAVQQPTAQVELALGSKNAAGKGMVVEQVLMNNVPQQFNHAQDVLSITLPSQATTGTMLVLTITYNGIPADGLIIGKNLFGDRTFFGDNWPNRAHCWLPTVDHPSDKASVDFIVVAPSHYEVIANGMRVEESLIDKKQKLTHWHEPSAIPTKVMVIGAARFAIRHDGAVHNIPVEHWVYPQNRLEGFHDYGAAKHILDFFVTHIGPYPYPKLANVQSKTRYGGMENASNIFYNEEYINGKADHNDLIAHEIAHQWFGNSASEKDWSHIWLSEGFATYFTHLYNEYALGAEHRRQGMKRDRAAIIDYYQKNPSPVVNTSYKDLMQLLNTNSYEKGSWVLHMLRLDIGDDHFWKGIREYYKKFAHGNALTADFRLVMEGLSGADLTPFFEQWLYRAGHPVLKKTWRYDGRKKVVEITVEQLQKGTAYQFPLEIGLRGDDGRMTVEKIKMGQRVQKFSIQAPNKPVEVVLDPEVNLLFEEK